MFCTKIKNKLKAIMRHIDEYTETHVAMALKITTSLKRALTSPVADILTAIIPGDLDNALRDQVVNALDKITEALTIADACKNCTNLNDRLRCLAQQLQQRDPNLQDAILHKLASLLAGSLDGNRLRQSLYDLYTQTHYTSTKIAA